MGSLLGGKQKAVSSNPAWLDKAGEDLYNIAKSFVFNPTKPTTTSGSQPSSPAVSAQPGGSTLFPTGPVYYDPKTMRPVTNPVAGQQYLSGGKLTTYSPAGTGGIQAGTVNDASFENIRGLPMYQGQRYADLDPSFQRAEDYASAYAGANKGFRQARDYLGQSTARYGTAYDQRDVDTSTFGQEDLDRFLNPYIKAALETTSDEMARVAQQDRLRQNAGMVSKGAFGGSRQAIEDAELTRNLLDRTGSMFKQGMSEGYDRALSNYMQEAARKLQAGQFNESQRLQGFNSNRDQFNQEQNRLQSAAAGLGNLASIESNIASQDVERLLRTGAAKQTQKQNLLDFAYQQFLEQRDWPYQQLERLSGIVSGSPSKGAITMVDKPNPLAQIAGVGLSLATGGMGGSAAAAGGGSFNAAAAANGLPWSDEQLKEDITPVGRKNGFTVVEFRYLGGSNRYRGVLAQEVQEKMPEAVAERDGYLSVDYDKIGIPFERVA